jgi:DNA-binding transcriptional regulator/RsmH inhibitor MraZ
MSKLLILITLALGISLSGCGGGGGSSSAAGNPPPLNQAPTVNAGADQSVDEGTTVVLSALGMDDDTVTSYSWEQESGTAVTITNADLANASFGAPMIAASEVLIFRVTVTDNDGATGSDTVSISVNDTGPPLPPPPALNLVFEGEFGSFGMQIGQFNRTRAVAVDSQNRIVIADRENNRIQLCDFQGVVCTAFGSAGSAAGEFMAPQGIAVDSLDRIIVADLNNRVQICSDVGLCTAFGGQGTALGQFAGLAGIDVDSQDRIFIADTLNNRVQICDDQGICSAFDIDEPHGIAVDSQGRIIVTSRATELISICDEQGNCSSFGGLGTEPGLFSDPFTVSTDSQDRIYVTDRSNNRIQICDDIGNCQAFGGIGTGPREFDRPGGIFVDNQDRIIVGDTYNHRIQIFSIN